MIWAQIKGCAARLNTTPPFTANKMLTLLEKACSEVTPDNWRKVEISLLKNVTINFTNEQLLEISKWFDGNSVQETLNGESTNVITTDQLNQFLDLKKYHKRNFHYPSYMEIMTDAENLTAGGALLLTKEHFIFMLNKWVILPNIKHEMLLAFGVFDTEKRNFLDLEEVQIIVTKYGDAFNDAELREILRDANVRGDGNVFYHDFVESLFSIAPELLHMKVEYLYENPDEDPSVSKEIVVEEEPKQRPSPPPLPLPPPEKNAKKKK